MPCKTFIKTTPNTYHFHDTYCRPKAVRFCHTVCTIPEQPQASRDPEQKTDGVEDSCVFKAHSQTRWTVLTQTSTMNATTVCNLNVKKDNAILNCNCLRARVTFEYFLNTWNFAILPFLTTGITHYWPTIPLIDFIALTFTNHDTWTRSSVQKQTIPWWCNNDVCEAKKWSLNIDKNHKV